LQETELTKLTHNATVTGINTSRPDNTTETATATDKSLWHQKTPNAHIYGCII